MDKKGDLIKTVPVLRGQMARYPSIDPTLTVSGAAADARVTGDKLAEHERRLIIQERQVDATLTVSGAAADAKVTGEKFNEFDERIKQAAEDVSSVPGKVSELEKTTAEHQEQLDAQEKELDVQAKTQKSQADKMAALQKTLDEQKEDIDEKLPAYRLGEAVNEALAQAKASGEFDGVSVTHKWNGTVLEITSASGMKSMDLQGEKGEDGYTPQKGVDYFDGEDGEDGKDGADGVSVTHEWDGTVLRVTSASGTTEADLKGNKGDDGYTPQKGVDYFDGDDGYTPQKGVDYFDGEDGKDGKDGADGVSVTHEWNGTVLRVTSASGTTEADLKGERGDDGYTPQKGVDYFDGEDGKDGADYTLTETDKEEVANIVKGLLPVEPWTFTMENNTEIEKKVVVM